MGEEKKKKESNNNNNNNNNNNTKSNVTVVLKADLHCEGCATKVLKCIRSFDGVETASIDDGQKIRVVGKVDPVKLREKVEHKTHKKVELISPLPKNDKNKENNNNNNNNTKGKGNNNNINENKQKEDKNNNNNNKDKNTEEKKPKAKEPSVTTAVFKVHLHCEGCIQKIYKTVTKTKGYEEMKVDKEKELVTIRGTIDMKALGETLKKNLKKEVQLVEPKKENNNKEKKKKGGNNDNDNDTKEGEEKESNNNKGEKKKAEGNKMDYNNPDSNPYIYGPPGLGVVGDQQFHYYHAPQIFSDENPNACTVM